MSMNVFELKWSWDRKMGIGLALVLGALFLFACGQSGGDSAGITNTGNTNKISGEVQGDGVVASSGPLADVSVYLSSYGDARYVDTAITNADGRFEFTALDSGTWVLTVSYGGATGTWQTTFTTTQASVGVLFTVQAGGIVAVTVVEGSSSSMSSSGLSSSSVENTAMSSSVETGISSSSSFSSSSVALEGWCATAGNCGTFVDARDEQVYAWTRIGTQVWMAKNLNYAPTADSSWCYNNLETNCATYGRLYSWSTAMAVDLVYDSTAWGGSDVLHQGICPAGWHVPSYAEWVTLVDYAIANGASTAAEPNDNLKANSTLWAANTGVDTYAFAALPSGYYLDKTSLISVGFFGLGSKGTWWAATENLESSSGDTGMNMNTEWPVISATGSTGWYYTEKQGGSSVRCVQNVAE